MQNHTGVSHGNFSFIIDDIYNQKHSLLSVKVNEWMKQKTKFIKDNHEIMIEDTFEKIRVEHIKFQQIIHQTLKVINSEYQMLAKIKHINEDSIPKKISNIVVVKQNALSSQQSQIFNNSLSISHKKSSDIEQLCEFSSRFFAITSTQLNEFKSFNSQIQSRKQRFKFDHKKQLTEQSKLIEELTLKNPTKYFHLKNFQKLRQSFEKQLKLVQRTHNQLKVQYDQSLTKRKTIIQNCIDNMSYFEEIYVKIFCGSLTKEIKEYFIKLIQEIKTIKQQFDQKQNIRKDTNEEINNQFWYLLKKNQDIFVWFLEELTLGQWKRIDIQTTKKSSFTSFSALSFTSNANLKEQSTYEISHKELSMPGKYPTNNLQSTLYIVTLTMDYKLIFRRQSQKQKISKEYLLYELKIKSQRQGKKSKVSDQRMLVLKQKKNKQTIQLTFCDTDKREEFILHMERFQNLKNTLHK